MRVIIGDKAFNQCFLRVVLAPCGFDELVGATSTADLLDTAAAGADLIVFDPLIMEAASPDPIDIVRELAITFPRSRLLVLSPSPTVIERANSYGIASACKRSLYRLGEIEDAVRLAVGLFPVQVRCDAEAGPDAGVVVTRVQLGVAQPKAVDLTVDSFDMDELMRPRPTTERATALEPAATSAP